MSQIIVGNDMVLQNGLVNTVQVITTSLTITSTSGSAGGHSYMIGVNTDSSAITVTLPSDSSRVNGRTYYIFDSTGSATTYNITINGNGKNIVGNSIATISSPYNGLTVMYSTTAGQWLVI